MFHCTNNTPAAGGRSGRAVKEPWALTRCRAEARVVRKPLALPKPQEDSGVGPLFIQTCPKAPIFPGSGGRSNPKGNIPPAGHLSLLSQTLGSLSLNPGRPVASICCSTRTFLSLLPLASAAPEEPGLPGSWGPFLPHTLANPAGGELPAWDSVLGQYCHPSARSRLPAALQGITPLIRAPPGPTPAARLPSGPRSQASPDRSSCAHPEATATTGAIAGMAPDPAWPGQNLPCRFLGSGWGDRTVGHGWSREAARPLTVSSDWESRLSAAESPGSRWSSVIKYYCRPEYLEGSRTV